MAASNVQDQIFSKLKVSLEGQKAQAAFCCGGSSEINDELSRPDIRFKEAPPVILHWATDEQQSIQKISFSQNALKTDELKNQVQRLTDACQPASFGKGGKDVNDGRQYSVQLYVNSASICWSSFAVVADLALRIVPKGWEIGFNLLHDNLSSP